MLPRRLITALERPALRSSLCSLRSSTAVQQLPSARGRLSRGLVTTRASSQEAVQQLAEQEEMEEEERYSRAPRGQGTKLTMLNRYRALVLDSTYQPIDVVNWQRAICLEIATKVDVLEYYEDVTVKAPSDEFMLPAVVRVRYFSKRGIVKHVRVALNRHNIFMRDNFQCQYCGSEQHLTIDHVVPSCLGGKNSWENLVTACSKCNSHKGSKSLQELKWKLRNKPREPSPHELTMMVAQWNCQAGGSTPPQWDTYLQPLFAGKLKPRRAQQNKS